MLAPVFLLGGCLSNTSDRGETRFTTIAAPSTIKNSQSEKIVTAYRQAFDCWQNSAFNKEGYQLKSFTELDGGKKMEVIFFDPNQSEVDAIRFYIDLGVGFWGNYIMQTEGPGRHSDLAEHIISQHQYHFVKLCNVGTISVSS